MFIAWKPNGVDGEVEVDWLLTSNEPISNKG